MDTYQEDDRNKWAASMLELSQTYALHGLHAHYLYTIEIVAGLRGTPADKARLKAAIEAMPK
jgi:hypothetical protein